MEAFIFFFCWSANVLKGKSKARKADLKEEKLFHTRPYSEASSTLWSGATGYHRLLFIAFISEDMEDQSVPVASHFCLRLFLRGKLFILDSHLQMHLSSCIIREEITCMIMDKVFHSLSVFLYCCCVSVSVKRTNLERDHCSGSRCQGRQGHSWD